MQEMAKDIVAHQKGRNQATAAELVEFMNRVRAGMLVSNAEILRFAPLFNDELTLDNLDRIYLINMCKFAGIQPFGTDAFLRNRIRAHLRQLKEDDREIREEGLAALTDAELRDACRARAIRAPFGPHARKVMERQLDEWLELSLDRALPSSLLLMSRAMTISQPLDEAKMFTGLTETLQTLPDEVLDRVEDEVEAVKGKELAPGASERARQASKLEARLELIREEEEAIREEAQEKAERDRALGVQEPKAAQAAEAPAPTMAAEAAKAEIRGHTTAREAAAAAAARAIFRAAALSVASEAKAGVCPAFDLPQPLSV